MDTVLWALSSIFAWPIVIWLLHVLLVRRGDNSDFIGNPVRLILVLFACNRTLSSGAPVRMMSKADGRTAMISTTMESKLGTILARRTPSADSKSYSKAFPVILMGMGVMTACYKKNLSVSRSRCSERMLIFLCKENRLSKKPQHPKSISGKTRWRAEDSVGGTLRSSSNPAIGSASLWSSSRDQLT